VARNLRNVKNRIRKIKIGCVIAIRSNSSLLGKCCTTLKKEQQFNNMKLTRKQIERQDFVDNSIFALLQTLNTTDKVIDWDIEIIGSIRDVIQDNIINKIGCSEQEFYPYVEE